MQIETVPSTRDLWGPSSSGGNTMVDETYGPKSSASYDESRRLQKSALDELPEGTSTHARGATTYAPYPMIYLTDGNGATVTDIDGNTYIDYLCGFSSIIQGHCIEEQIEAAKGQLDQGTLFGTAHQLEYETAQLVNEVVPGAELTKFANSGTEGTMAAIRLARAYTGKEKIVKFEGMYHGHHDYVLVNQKPALSDVGSRRNPTKIPAANGIPRGTVETVEPLPWNDLKLLEEKFARQGDEIAAVLTEAVMSNGGLIRPSPRYLDRVREITRRHDSLLILDEVVTGFRMALGGAQAHFDLEPDLAVFGKALANGYPVGALTGREEVMRFLRNEPDKAPFLGTYTGNPLALSGAKANIELLREKGDDAYARMNERGQRLVDTLRDLTTDAGHDVFIPDPAGYFFMLFHNGKTNPEEWTEWRDVGPHINVDRYVTFAREMIGRGVYFIPRFGRINLTHAHTDEHIDETIEAAKDAIKEVPTE